VSRISSIRLIRKVIRKKLSGKGSLYSHCAGLAFILADLLTNLVLAKACDVTLDHQVTRG
jgi:hypothetical protein